MTTPETIHVATTAVGRMLVRETFTSFFRHARFSGRFRFVVSVDRTYGVGRAEYEETLAYLRGLPGEDPRVAGVTIETWDRNVGLQRSLLAVLAHCHEPFGVHLEDDWRFFHDFDLDALLQDLVEQRSVWIGLNSTHVSARGTFERAGEVEAVAGSRVPLVRLVPPSWACDYLPLCPHVHQAREWIPTYVKALMQDHDPDRCPDELVRDYVRNNGLRERLNVLWTRDVVVEDTGRAWQAARNVAKAITPDEDVPRPDAHVATDGDGRPILARSRAKRREALALIPGETQTFMKRPVQFAPDAYPMYLERGAGCRVWDIDGNVYLDFIAALGAASLGFAPPEITSAVASQLRLGHLLSLPTRWEVEASRELALTVPNVEMVRFLKTGADACSAAVRLARRITGRTRIATCGYHGWHDLFTPGTPGVPARFTDEAVEFDPSACDGDRSLERVLERHDRTVAVVLVAVPYDRVLDRDRVRRIRTLCDEHGALLVFDEAVTGFRLATGGAQEYFGVQADVVCYSKALAAGMPLSAVAGPRRTMEALGELHVSSTFAGDTLGLVAAVVALSLYRGTDVVARVGRLGRQLADGLNAAAAAVDLPPVARGYDPLPCLRFADDAAEHARLAEVFLRESARRGVLFRRDVNIVTGAHREDDIELAVRVARESLAAVARAVGRVKS